MYRKCGIAALAIAVCTLLAGAASNGPQHERPYKLWGEYWQFTLNIDPDSPNYGWMDEYGTGIATLRGRVTVEGGGWVDMNTGVYYGSGVASDPSGAQTFWWVDDTGLEPVIYIDGGTGRFENAVGEARILEMFDIVVEVQWPYQITTCKLTAEGWLTY